MHNELRSESTRPYILQAGPAAEVMCHRCFAKKDLER